MKVHEALNVIRDHGVFTNTDEAEPLAIAAHGRQAHLSLSDNVNDRYDCGGNVMWQDRMWLANQRVPKILVWV